MDLIWRSPLREWWNGVYADWLVELESERGEGSYLIRDCATKRVLYTSAPTTNVFRDLDRHLLGWCCDGSAYFALDRIEIALLAVSSARQDAA